MGKMRVGLMRMFWLRLRGVHPQELWAWRHHHTDARTSQEKVSANGQCRAVQGPMVESED